MAVDLSVWWSFVFGFAYMLYTMTRRWQAELWQWELAVTVSLFSSLHQLQIFFSYFLLVFPKKNRVAILEFFGYKRSLIFSVCIIDQIYVSDNASVPYPTTHQSEQKCAPFYSDWCILGYGKSALWDLWDWSSLGRCCVSGLILGLRSANERRRYKVTPSLSLAGRKPRISPVYNMLQNNKILHCDD